MKELKFIILLATILLFSSSAAFAAPSNLYWHTYDYYSIELSGSGNAFIVGTLSFEPLTPQNVSSVTLEIPYRDITIYKVVQNGRYYYPPCLQVPCVSASCPPCYQQYQPSAFLNYTTQTLSDSTILNINLAYPIMNDTDTTVYLIFSTKNIAQKNWQGFSFDFETVKDPNALIRSLSANVVIPENMYLKWKPQFNIQYKPSDVATQALSGTAEQVSSVLRSYPVYGGGQYSANNLQPGESFTISGLYGDNQILLYTQEIGWGILGLLVLALIVRYFLAAKVKKLFTPRRESEERISRRASEFSFSRAILIGAISSLIFISVFYLLNVIFTTNFYYSPIGSITLLLLNAVFILLSLFGLPSYLYSQFSKLEGVIAAIISLVLSFVFLMLFLPQYTPPIFYGLASTFTKAVGGTVSSGTATVVSS